MAGRFFKLILISGLFITSITIGASVQEEMTTERIRTKVEQIRNTNELRIGDAGIASVNVLPELYERCGFCLLWDDPNNVDDLMREVEQIEEDGLDSDDYHFGILQNLRSQIKAGESANPSLVTDFDMLLTDSLIRLGYHLIFGKVDPEDLDPHWNLAQEIDNKDPVDEIEKMLKSGDLAKTLDGLRPQHVLYANYKTALKKYRAIQATGGWEPVPPGPALKKGMTDKRVSMLRNRLSVTGDLQDATSDSAFFDGQLEQAIIHFQNRHRLTADGTVGKNTLEALNVPVEARIDQIRVNLERARWVLHAISGRFVLVDIAGFHVFFYQDDGITWGSRVQVGNPYRRTPVFRSDIKYLVFNPTWTIPPGILNKDVLPAVKKNPNYLKERNIDVIDDQGNIINQDTINWSQYPKQRFPYMLRQDPGPQNALGQIKFMFPNEHLVYLHDTPSRSLFAREHRTFSSGCIRVEKPFELAKILLDNPNQWTQETIKKVIESRKPRTVNLPEHIPVLMLYWTVAVDQDGTIHFKNDPYGRDMAVLEGLEEDFKFRKRPFGKKRLTL